AGAVQGHLHAFDLPLGVGQDEVGGVAVDAVANNLAVNLGAPGLGIAQPFQHVNATAFGHHDTVAVAIERPRRLVGIVVVRQGPLALETGEIPRGVDAFGNAARQGQVAFAQPEHLHALDHAQVAGGTGGPDGVVRSGDSQVER